MTETPQKDAPKTAGEKFMKDLTMKERMTITRRLGVGFSELDSSYEEEMACALIFTAARRLKKDEVTWEALEEMKADQMTELGESLLAELGFDDDEPEEADPLEQENGTGSNARNKKS